MKKIVLIMLMVLPLMAGAQTKIKETAVPRSVLLALEKTYDSYKVRTWYQAPGQYIAEVVIDGQNGRAYFTAGGDWQYSTFPVKAEECPTLMNTYFVNNYPGYRIKSIDFIEEMNGDNYYRMIIVKKGIAEADCEMIFDTRGKLMKSNAPDPDAVKRGGVFDPAFVEGLVREYSQPEFKLMGAYEIDYLLIVATVTMLCERFRLTV